MTDKRVSVELIKELKINIDSNGSIFVNVNKLSDIEIVGICELIRTRYIVKMGRATDKHETITKFDKEGM
jgi:hypothetical protein